MNVLQPKIVKIDNRRYRRNLFLNSGTGDSFEQPNEPYVEETAEMFIENSTRIRCNNNDDDDDSECQLDRNNQNKEEEDDFKDIEMIKSNGKDVYQCKMKVNQSYYGYIIGRNGERKASIEKETSTRIKIPFRNQKEVIFIESENIRGVASCRNRLMLLISSARHQKQFTHLITYPINFDGFKLKFNEFKQAVLADVNGCARDRGVSPNIFINENKLHLTICVLTLIGDNELDEAVELLEQCRQTFIKDLLNKQSIRIHLKGLEYMNDDPSHVDVLYASVSDNGDLSRIQEISNKIMMKFEQTGLCKKQYDRVKLHATLMNSLLTTDPSGTSQANRNSANKLVNERESFDARNILTKFAHFDFGVYELKEIHLSIRFSSGSNSYYDYASKISL